MTKRNFVTCTDSYKMCHHQQYDPTTQFNSAYFEARKGAKFDYTVFCGLQPIMKDWLEGVVITKEKIDKAEKLASRHFGNGEIFNRARWDYIVEKHGGKLPLKIKAVREGTVVPVDNVMMQVINTDPVNCAWLTNHAETLLTHVWYPSTVATLSRATKEMFKTYLNETCDDGENFGGLPFMLHDFGMRGVSSMESAGIGGMGHLINFLGTDTVIAMEFIEDYYGGVETGFSVPATEHSVMTAKGREGEAGIIQQLLNSYPTGILSVVSDSYDIYNCVDQYYGVMFKDQILARDGKFVVRPDSGDPVKVVCGEDTQSNPPTLEEKGLLEILWDRFGGTVNNKGYKVLNPKVGLIWGDGIDIEGIRKVLEATKNKGFSVENLVFGKGGGLLQKVNRDTQRFAFKSSAQMRDNVWYDVFKDPIDGSKSSKRGILKLIKVDGEYKTVKVDDPEWINYADEMVTVFENGEILKEYSFDEVRENSTK